MYAPTTLVRCGPLLSPLLHAVRLKRVCCSLSLQVVLLKAKDVSDRLLHEFTLLGYPDARVKAIEALKTSLAILGYVLPPPSPPAVAGSGGEDDAGLHSSSGSSSTNRGGGGGGGGSHPPHSHQGGPRRNGKLSEGKDGHHTHSTTNEEEDDGYTAGNNNRRPKNVNWIQGRQRRERRHVTTTI